MKRLLTILSVLICAQSFGQIYQSQNGYGFQYKHLKIDSTLHIPTFCGVPTLRGSVVGNQAAIAFDSCNNKLYVYNPKDSTWKIQSVTSVDSIFFSSSATVDTVKYIKNGSEYVAGYIDLSGTDSLSYHTLTIAPDSSYATWNRPNDTKDTLPLPFLKKTDSVDVALLNGGKIDTAHIPIFPTVISHEGAGLWTIYASGSDTIHAKNLQAGTGITLTPNADSSITISSTGGSGGGGTTADSTLTATAGQTSFTFSSVPTSTKDYIIFINGNATESFTASGDTITLTITDLLAGDKVRYKRIK